MPIAFRTTSTQFAFAHWNHCCDRPKTGEIAESLSKIPFMEMSIWALLCRPARLLTSSWIVCATCFTTFGSHTLPTVHSLSTSCCPAKKRMKIRFTALRPRLYEEWLSWKRRMSSGNLNRKKSFVRNDCPSFVPSAELMATTNNNVSNWKSLTSVLFRHLTLLTLVFWTKCVGTYSATLLSEMWIRTTGLSLLFALFCFYFRVNFIFISVDNQSERNSKIIFGASMPMLCWLCLDPPATVLDLLIAIWIFVWHLNQMMTAR